MLPISERQAAQAKALAERLCDAGLRAEADMRGEKIGYKIREAQMQRVPSVLLLYFVQLRIAKVKTKTRCA